MFRFVVISLLALISCASSINSKPAPAAKATTELPQETEAARWPKDLQAFCEEAITIRPRTIESARITEHTEPLGGLAVPARSIVCRSENEPRHGIHQAVLLKSSVSIAGLVVPAGWLITGKAASWRLSRREGAPPATGHDARWNGLWIECVRDRCVPRSGRLAEDTDLHGLRFSKEVELGLVLNENPRGEVLLVGRAAKASRVGGVAVAAGDVVAFAKNVVAGQRMLRSIEVRQWLEEDYESSPYLGISSEHGVQRGRLWSDDGAIDIRTDGKTLTARCGDVHWETSNSGAMAYELKRGLVVKNLDMPTSNYLEGRIRLVHEGDGGSQKRIDLVFNKQEGCRLVTPHPDDHR